jgi:hypothetical protein
MKKIPNLPIVDLMSFSEVVEKRPTLLVTSKPAWNAEKNSLRGLNIAETIEVTEANTAHWDTLQSKIKNLKSYTPSVVDLSRTHPNIFQPNLTCRRWFVPPPFPWMHSSQPHRVSAVMDVFLHRDQSSRKPYSRFGHHRDTPPALKGRWLLA